MFSYGSILMTLCFSLASVACDSASAESGSPSGSAPNGSDPSGDGGGRGIQGGTAVAALALSSCIPAVYALPLSIGNSEPFDVTLDTGSTSIGVASSSCSGCDVEPKFSPEASVIDQGVQAKSEYLTGRWSGKVYEGEISLAPQTKASVKFVAIQEQENFFVAQACGSKSGSVQGIIGFGPASGAIRGTTGFFDRFVAKSNVPDIFATELCDEGGLLWLGGYDSAHTTAAPRYTPLLGGALNYYAVHLANIAVDGTTVPVGSTRYPRTIVDTGSSVFLLPSSAFTPLTKAIAANSKFEALVGEGASWFDNPDGRSCKKLSTTKSELDAALPPLTLTFGTGAAAIAVRAAPTESYLANYEGQWCSTLVSFEPSADLPIASVMGAPVMRSNIVIFDREGQRIGFAPHTPCK
ncbi:MAG TPA: pepsin-like aspartic protease [Labilithrix sp.]|nr:pepsin-like aspartic protease [Labilithrix sp.]